MLEGEIKILGQALYNLVPRILKGTQIAAAIFPKCRVPVFVCKLEIGRKIAGKKCLSHNGRMKWPVESVRERVISGTAERFIWH